MPHNIIQNIPHTTQGYPALLLNIPNNTEYPLLYSEKALHNTKPFTLLETLHSTANMYGMLLFSYADFFSFQSE